MSFSLAAPALTRVLSRIPRRCHRFRRLARPAMLASQRLPNLLTVVRHAMLLFCDDVLALLLRQRTSSAVLIALMLQRCCPALVGSRIWTN